MPSSSVSPLSPGLTLAVLTAEPQPVVLPQPSRQAVASGRSSSILTSDVSDTVPFGRRCPALTPRPHRGPRRCRRGGCPPRSSPRSRTSSAGRLNTSGSVRTPVGTTLRRGHRPSGRARRPRRQPRRQLLRVHRSGAAAPAGHRFGRGGRCGTARWPPRTSSSTHGQHGRGMNRDQHTLGGCQGYGGGGLSPSQIVGETLPCP